MTYKVENSLRNFEFWSGGKDRAEMLNPRELDAIEEYLEEIYYGDGMPTETEINDFLWFDFDFITTDILGYEKDDAIFYRDTEKHFYRIDDHNWYSENDIRKEYEEYLEENEYTEDEILFEDYLEENFNDVNEEGYYND